MTPNSRREFTDCPLCGEQRACRQFGLRDHTLVECSACRLLYVRDRVPEVEMHNFYGENYFRSVDELSQGYSDYEEMGRDRERTFAGYLKRILPYLKRREQVLDIGCGYGFFLNAASAHFRKLAGIDVSHEALQRVNPAFDVHCERFHAGLFPSHFADLIMMCDFVEHLYRPVEFLDEVRKVLHPEGVLCLVTPNRDSLLSRLSGKRWVSYKLPEHVCYYNPATMRRLLSMTGYRSLQMVPCGQYASLEFIAKRLGHLAVARDIGFLIPRAMRGWPVYVNSGSMLVLARPDNSVKGTV